MKILIVQLARLGDIYISWPIARALKRKHTNAEIHFLVRDKFHRALVGLEACDKCLVFKTQDVIEKAIENPDDPTIELAQQLDIIKNEDYDLIINLTFSPVSSFMCYYLQSLKTKVLGYTRNIDSS
ncbi:MAG: glycosyltransferase family 9 protein, partial [Bdellovibrionales bacterium]|nr:glycosyltransferase family 9 protein [Bdellovibrionales bacterium]